MPYGAFIFLPKQEGFLPKWICFWEKKEIQIDNEKSTRSFTGAFFQCYVKIWMGGVSIISGSSQKGGAQGAFPARQYSYTFKIA